MDEVHEPAFSMQEWREGSPRAFRQLFFQYYPRFYGFASSFLAERPSCVNIVTEAFFLLWIKRQYLDTEKDIQALLYNTIRNSCFTYLKYKQQHPDTPVYLPHFKMDPSFPEETLQEMLTYATGEIETK